MTAREVPPVLRGRLLSLRAYDRDGMIVEADAVLGDDVEAPALAAALRARQTQSTSTSTTPNAAATLVVWIGHKKRPGNRPAFSLIKETAVSYTRSCRRRCCTSCRCRCGRG